MNFVLDRQLGSHTQWKVNNKTVTVPINNEYPTKTGKSILQQIANAAQKNYKDIIVEYNVKL